MANLKEVLNKYRKESFSKRNNGDKFELLIKNFLLTYPMYKNSLSKVWMWQDFPFKDSIGKQDVGIDLVARTFEDEYWAIQCKCFDKNTYIDKGDVDTFLSTSTRTFVDEQGQTRQFAFRLWIDTSEKGMTSNAWANFQNQIIPAARLGYWELLSYDIDWKQLDESIHSASALRDKKHLMEHQATALDKAIEYFQTSDRGKLIMACGTGKTYTSLKIAEQLTSSTGTILFLVPSIALLSQTLREWNYDAEKQIHSICICSDSQVSRKKSKQMEDENSFLVEDLAMPASTNVNNIIYQVKTINRKRKEGMLVVFSTYQSINVVSEAQKLLGEDLVFDLIVCDEAHRTTGVTLKGEEESNFVRVHDNDFIKAKKRLYMTATPRLYKQNDQIRAREKDAYLCSMDDAVIYGNEIYRIGFGEAVDRNLLSDYKVLVLTVSAKEVSNNIFDKLKAIQQGEDTAFEIDDAAKLIGCINALSKKTLSEHNILRQSDPEPMRKAVAFCRTIAWSKVTSQALNICSENYREELDEEEKRDTVLIKSSHVDGSMGASFRDEKLQWLKETPNNSTECRVLTNVRCLSEGVDVPSLDAILFFSPKNSQVDVVQSVGRVMRKAEGKKYGYIIIPVVVPEDADPNTVLDNNDDFKIVWDILNALRAHDDRFNAIINKIELNKNRPQNILLTGSIFGEMGANKTPGTSEEEIDNEDIKETIAQQMELQFEKMQSVVYARMVEKVGNKRYWEQWAEDVAKIAERHIQQITNLINTDDKARKEFDRFLKGLHKNINPSVKEQTAIEMLAQHIITKPVFEALFENYSFAANNPISKAMNRIINLLNERIDEQDHENLEKFYRSVKLRAEGIDNSQAKQKIVVELYDKFFRLAFKKVTEQLGIVYTPVEVVDFIIRSVEYVLNKEFSRSLTDKNVNIIDPFTGTGTFITRLLQSGIIKQEDLERKYKYEIFANEIVLLAYYIASINIENVYHDLQKNNDTYQSFEGICLTDTFQLGEQMYSKQNTQTELIEPTFPENTARIKRQIKKPITVIIGNPPYSVGQKSANDNAQNQHYPLLEEKLRQLYIESSSATNNNAVHDSYVKAFRWATDRLNDTNNGVIAFITNAGWLDSNSFDGFRKSLEKEFSAIYVLNLRGAIRGRSGEAVKKEGQNIFDIMTGVAITILIKKPTKEKEKATIYYYSMEDYLNRKEKLEFISTKKYTKNIPFEILTPNEHGDWINKRNDSFSNYIPIEPEKKFSPKEKSFFTAQSCGLKTNRDRWCYNANKSKLENNIIKSIDFYNSEVQRIKGDKSIRPILDDTKFSWDRDIFSNLYKNIKINYSDNNIGISLYRPYYKQYLYYAKYLNNQTYQIPSLFPTSKHPNLLICIPGIGDTKDFSCIISNLIPDLGIEGASQCFPLYYYEKRTKERTLFDNIAKDDYIRRDAITDFILQRTREQYGNRVIKEDIFYYVYGFLHCENYRKTFANDLKKMLPRIPLVEKAEDFWVFSKAGRQLADLHLNYETIEPYNKCVVVYQPYEQISYRVQKMKFGGTSKQKDKTTIIYNNLITINNIPLKAYEYVVNGKSAIEWIMERYAVKIDIKSGITNDSNDWCDEVGDEKYIFNLLLRIINLSCQSVDIINSLPKVEFE